MNPGRNNDNIPGYRQKRDPPCEQVKSGITSHHIKCSWYQNDHWSWCEKLEDYVARHMTFVLQRIGVNVS